MSDAVAWAVPVAGRDAAGYAATATRRPRRALHGSAADDRAEYGADMPDCLATVAQPNSALGSECSLVWQGGRRGVDREPAQSVMEAQAVCEGGVRNAARR